MIEADRADKKLIVDLHGVTGVVEAQDDEAMGVQMANEDSTIRCEVLGS